MTRVEMPEDVLRWDEATLQGEIMRLAEQLGWHVPTTEWKRTNEQLAALHQPPDPLPGIAFHPRIAYRSEPGWPDLTLVRRRDRRLLFAELKREGKEPTPRQAAVLDLLSDLDTSHWDCAAHGRSTDPKPQMPRCAYCVPLIQVRVWRPADWLSNTIEEVLR